MICQQTEFIVRIDILQFSWKLVFTVVCQVPKNHTAYVIDHNWIDIRMDPVVGEDENCLYGYHVLFKNLDDPNSVWVANEIHRRNPPGRVRIPRLHPYTNYSFRVVARSFKSGGLISEAIQAKTDEWGE